MHKPIIWLRAGWLLWQQQILPKMPIEETVLGPRRLWLFEQRCWEKSCGLKLHTQRHGNANQWVSCSGRGLRRGLGFTPIGKHRVSVSPCLETWMMWKRTWSVLASQDLQSVSRHKVWSGTKQQPHLFTAINPQGTEPCLDARHHAAGRGTHKESRAHSAHVWGPWTLMEKQTLTDQWR